MGGGPSRNFNDLPDSTKATTAKGVDEIILNLRSYGNIPGQPLIDDEETWLCPPEEQPVVDTAQTVANTEMITPTDDPQPISNGAQKTTNNNLTELDGADNSPAREKPKPHNKKKHGVVAVGHVDSPQTLISLR